ncbi:hypothetical protein Zm00014a_024803 [Zea mays]|uniref:VHS domain-containing protein n=2 Tax=Zea mays TaxID=4577 RepID=A0A3L6FEW1_MAIZE|nr:hypothetical protein Zm00014a_024803 [Zea mays]
MQRRRTAATEGWPARQSATVRMRNVAVLGAACGAMRRSTAGAARRSVGDDRDEQHSAARRREGQYGFKNGEGGDERQAQGDGLGKEHRNLRAHGAGSWLLEMLLNNCGEPVHRQVIDNGLLPILVKIVKKKTDLPVREKIFLLLDATQTSLGGAKARFPQYYEAYYELVVGIIFAAENFP